MICTAEQVKLKLAKYANANRRNANYRFFKTDAGQYGENDEFVGISVPDIRTVAKIYSGLSVHEITKLITSPYHEHRLCATIILTYQYDKDSFRDSVYDFYLDILLNKTTLQTPPDYKVQSRTRSGIDNWDIVDTSAHKIVGRHILNKSHSILYELANSKQLWQNRVAIVATGWLISKDHFEDTLNISEMFLSHNHDLIHKATGWMLREVGKKDELTLISFLQEHAHEMPRTMLRYSIEKLSKIDKIRFMDQKINYEM